MTAGWQRPTASIHTLAAETREHLIAKKRAGKVTDAWIAATEGFLRRAVEFFGADRELEDIRPSDVREYAAHLLLLRPGIPPRTRSARSRVSHPGR